MTSVPLPRERDHDCPNHRRHRPLCRHHVEQNLVAPHHMVSIEGLGASCEWCGDDTPADFMVCMTVDGPW